MERGKQGDEVALKKGERMEEGRPVCVSVGCEKEKSEREEKFDDVDDPLSLLKRNDFLSFLSTS